MSFRPAALLFAFALFAAAARAGTAPAAAQRVDARAEVAAAFKKSAAAKSLRISTTYLGSPGLVAVTEFQRPDRIRSATTNQPTSVVIGKTMYIQYPDRVEKHAFPAQEMAPFFLRDPARRELDRGAYFELIATETLGGEPAHVFRWLPLGENSTSGKLWVGVRSGYVLQEEVNRRRKGKDESTRTRFDRYDTVRIDAPKP